MALAVNPVALMALAKDARSAAWQVTLSLFIKRSVILYCTFLFAYNVRMVSHNWPATPIPCTIWYKKCARNGSLNEAPTAMVRGGAMEEGSLATFMVRSVRSMQPPKEAYFWVVPNAVSMCRIAQVSMPERQVTYTSGHTQVDIYKWTYTSDNNEIRGKKGEHLNGCQVPRNFGTLAYLLETSLRVGRTGGGRHRR
jgi:hypothetical protein